MTTAGELLVDYLGDVTAITDIVSTRISVGYREDGDAMPCIVIDIDNVDSSESLSGSPSLDIVGLTVDCLHTRYAEAVELADAALVALAGSSGTYETKTFSMSATRSAASLTPAPDGGYVVSYPIAVILYMEP